jgi:CBS domain-containing protein
MIATITKPLLALAAADLMSTDLLLIPQEMSLSAAARLLSRNGVRGAPVVDENGRCVGMLTTSDFMHWAELDRRPGEPLCEEAPFYLPWQLETGEVLPDDAVTNYMTPDPVTVTRERSIGDLARMMLEREIHRVIVVDGEDTPLGIVTCTDLVSAMARAGGP